MRKKPYRLKDGAFLLFGIFLLLLLLTNTQLAMDGVRRGISLCSETLFPSLFPFLVLSEWMVKKQAGDFLGKYFGKPLSACLGLSEKGAASLLLGALCGFPVGTTTAVAFYERGEMSKEELQRLNLCANNPGSGFLIGAVGKALFGNHQAGITLFLIVWLSSLLIAVFLRFLYGPIKRIPQNEMANPQKAPSASDFTTSVKRAFSSLLQVFSFVIFFSCVSSCLSAILANYKLPAVTGTVLAGILEMTSGISHAVTTLSPENAFRLTAFFVGFAGISICLQLFAIAEKQKLPMGPYLLAKLTQGGLALLLAECYLQLFQPHFEMAQSMATFAQNSTQKMLTAGVCAFFLFSLLVYIPLAKYTKKHPRAKKKGLSH
ncbi:MAG: hypothetical protein E7585_06010 [Ruminococcaceae bacterium]|nr:hypothetical protein [Oscillospiraceae bacterium]